MDKVLNLKREDFLCLDTPLKGSHAYIPIIIGDGSWPIFHTPDPQ